MRLAILLLVFIHSYSGCFSQASEYDSLYAVSRNLLNSNPEKALTNVDYLYKLSKNNNERLQALMLKTTLLRNNGLKNHAISVAQQADSLADLIENHVIQARVNGLLSTLYRESGITTAGKKALQKAITASKKITDQNEAHKFRGNLQQELAYYEMADKEYKKAITYLKKGRVFFEKLGDNSNRNFYLATNSELTGKNYLFLKCADSASYFLEKARGELRNSQFPNSPLKGFIHNDLGNAYMLCKGYDNARMHYVKGLKVAYASGFYNLKEEVYRSLKNYYKTLGDTKNYIFYSDKLTNLIDNERQARKIIANKLIKNLHQEGENTREKYWRNNLIILFGSLLAILIVYFVYAYKRKQDYKKFKEFISEKNEPQEESPAKEGPGKEYMLKGTEEAILKKLNKFERSGTFLSQNISLGVVAVNLGVNNRYLSYVINKHKQKDFATYINELRINYIVDRLENDPPYLKYKISYLAEECGFASHSRFTTTFKKVTGVSPSSFIKYLKKEKAKKSG